MLELNKVMLVGRLTRDPEVRMFQSGSGVAQFALAVSRRRRDNQTGEYVEDTAFVDIKGFNRMQEFAEQYLRRGTGVYVEGRLVQERWEKEGQKFSKLVVYADQIRFAETRAEAEARMGRSDSYGADGGYGGGESAAPSYGGGAPQAPRETPSSMPPMPGGAAEYGEGGDGGTNDDLPF